VICIAVFAEEYKLAQRAISKYGKHIDLVELRLDTADRKTIEDAVASIDRPYILSCRPPEHGGRFKGTEAERLALLHAAMRYRPLYIDVELGTAAEVLLEGTSGQPFILSFHDPEGTPDNLEKIAAALFAKKPAIAKLVPRANRWMDNLKILETADSLSRESRRFICFGAGEAGIFSRAMAPSHGSAITYCSVEGAMPTALGQIRLSHAIDLFRINEITNGWKTYGIVGKPVAHSFSPAFHNAAFAMHGINAVYLPFPADSFGEFFDFAGRAGISGFSVTSPFKQEAADAAEAGDETTIGAKAANTLVQTDEGYRALNTDGTAFLEVLRGHGQEIEGCRILLLGSGGVVRSLAYPLRRAGAEVVICSRDEERGRLVASQLGCDFSCEAAALASAHVVVNATSITRPEEDTDGFLSRNFPVGVLAVDLHYDPPETFFLKEAALRGCRAVNGLEMFMRQAAMQFKLWTGVEPDAEATRQIPLFKL